MIESRLRPGDSVTKDELLDALSTFISQRSGIDRREYGYKWTLEASLAFNADYQTVLADGKTARGLLRAVAMRSTITADDILNHARFRLTFRRNAKGRVECEYTTGQYFPTEYRAAAVQLLKSVLWGWYASDLGAVEQLNPVPRIQAKARRDLGAKLGRVFAQ